MPGFPTAHRILRNTAVNHTMSCLYKKPHLKELRSVSLLARSSVRIHQKCGFLKVRLGGWITGWTSPNHVLSARWLLEVQPWRSSYYLCCSAQNSHSDSPPPPIRLAFCSLLFGRKRKPNISLYLSCIGSSSVCYCQLPATECILCFGQLIA